VPGQRRLAISRSRVPNLDGFVTTAAGNLFSIGAPRHWFDTEIARSQHTNQHKKEIKILKKLTSPSGQSTSNLKIASSPGTPKRTHWNQLTRPKARSPGTQKRKRSFWNLLHYIISSMYLSTKSYLFECFTQNAGNIFLLFSLAYPYKKRTLLSGRSPGTRKSTWWNHLYFYVFRAFISQKKSHFRVAGLTDTQTETWLCC